MRIGIFGDTHDHLIAVERALAVFADEGVEAVLHTGDFCSPFTLKLMLDRLEVPLHGVLGNNDGERAGLRKMLPELCDGPRHLELGGKSVCLVHDPERLDAEDEAAAEVIVFGHTHEGPKAESKDGRLYVTPGECCGWLTGAACVSVLETDDPAVRSVVVLEQESPLL